MKVGFSEASSLTTAFGRPVGRTPSEYRRNLSRGLGAKSPHENDLEQLTW
jgi:AraC-like DNA-binding protein